MGYNNCIMSRLIVDVREPAEYEQDHAKGAVNLPVSDIAAGSSRLSDVPKDTEIVLYCQSGGRANMAVQHLSQQGFTNLVNGINKQNVMSEYKL